MSKKYSHLFNMLHVDINFDIKLDLVWDTNGSHYGMLCLQAPNTCKEVHTPSYVRSLDCGITHCADFDCCPGARATANDF